MTPRPRWELAAGAVLCTLAGVFAGWAARRPPATAPQEPTGSTEQTLPAATLQNLGVTVAEVQPRDFVRHVSMAAIVVERPDTARPVFAPIAGRVGRIDVELGTVVAPDSTLATLVRGPLPRPSLTLTSDILEPAQENLHRSVLELRKAAEEVRIASTELERVERFTGKVGTREIPLIPRQRAIDLRYALARADKSYEQARHELKKHGLTTGQIDAVERGAPLPQFNTETWKRALAGNGLWPPAAEELYRALPPALRELPWATATIGELAASGLATGSLARWLSSDAGAGAHFLELGVLLQRGHTLADLKRLHATGAFEPVVRVAAPQLAGGASWDVHEILVKPGAEVTAGTALAVLHDPRRLYLRSEPAGGEVAALLGAVERGDEIAARPLIRGSGPDLGDLKIAFVRSDARNDGTVAFIDVANSVLARTRTSGGRASRTWRLRPGLKYVLRVPTGRLESVYVLPATAVTDDGPNKVVFLQDGDSFRPVPVRIVHRDHEVVVIPATKSVKIFSGDPIVQTGAFELGLALAASAATGGHQGHSH